MLFRKSEERGKNNISWLNANHSFSFGHYYDPNWTNFHQLLVINEDTITPAMGFGTHPHKNMEIITYVIAGQIKHRDSMGNTGLISPGEIQVMSAGTGVTHSEHNNLSDAPTHLLQIWVQPNANNIPPRYDQKKVYENQENNFLKVIAGPAEKIESIKLNADAQIWLGRYNHASSLEFSPQYFKNFWIQIVKGEIEIEGATFKSGDGLGFTQTNHIGFKIGNDGAEFLILEVNS